MHVMEQAELNSSLRAPQTTYTISPVAHFVQHKAKQPAAARFKQEDMDKVAVRNYIQCPYGTKWYSCNGGSCCSIDPCRLKNCPDARAKIPSASSPPTARPSYTNNSSSMTVPSSSATASDAMKPDPTRPLVQTTTTDAVTDDEATSTTESSTPESSPTRSLSSSFSSPPPSRPSIQSDSGVTHTIPNDSTVTVTRHTTITQELPSTSTNSPAPTTTDAGADTSASSSIVDVPLPTNTPAPNPDATQPPGGINTTVVAGIAVGGVFAAAALLAVVFWLWKRRRSRAAAEQAEDIDEPVVVDKARLRDSIFGRRPTPPSLPRHQTPHQASRQGYGYDPFAPFGGRADQPARNSTPPHPDTFEMDGRGIHVVELPGTSVTMVNSVPPDSPRRGVGARSVGAVKQRPSSDPRATLNHLPRQNGRPTYINQWNQYKVLSGEIHPRRK